MAIKIPMAPNNKADKKSIRSGILLPFFFERSLSTHMIR